MGKNIGDSLGDSECGHSHDNNSKINAGILGGIKHYINPLNVYCRLRDFGMPKKPAIFLCRAYEKNIYNGNGGSRASKLLKTIKDYSLYGKN